MMRELFNKGIKNYAYTVVALVITTLVSFVGTPIIIKHVGESDFGIYQLILQYLAYLSIWDFGLSTSSCSLLNKAHTSGDRKSVINTIKFLLRQYLKIVPLIVIALFAIIILVYQSIMKDQPPEYMHSLLIMAACGVFVPLNVFRDHLRSSEKFYIISKISTFQLSTMTCLNIYFAYNGYGLLGLAYSYFLLNFAFVALIFIKSYREIIKLPILNIPMELSGVKLWNNNLHSFFQNIFGQLSFASDTIILSFYQPTAAITNFVTNQRLAKLIDTLLSNIGNSFWSSISQTSSDIIQKQKAIDLINKVFLILAFPTICALGINNKSFIHLWLGPKFYISDLFTWISFSNFLIFGVLSFWGWLFVGEQKLEKKTKTIAISGLINIASSIILTKYLGIIGPVLGTFISFYFFYIWHMKAMMTKELGINVSDFLKRFFVLVLIVGIIAYFRSSFQFIQVTNWFELILNLALNYLLFLSCFLFIVFKKEDLDSASNYLGKFFKKP
ncbi:MAG: O-antigen/teichoic acid export membrane protein [Bacteriovoracaceae bacterium]|jgi:O-antigen/teichoic acid export membrane protein